jgi:hypothetical protein
MLIFVAHDYRVEPFANYRSTFSEVAGKRNVNFVFGNDTRSSTHLLSKIEEQIRNSDLGLFDVSTWNPNVILELGLARGFGRPHRLLFRPEVPSGWFRLRPSNYARIPADLEGIERVQYFDAPSLRDRLNEAVSDFKEGADLSRTANILFDRVQVLLSRHPDGLTNWEIASELNLDGRVTSAIVRGLVSDGRLGKSGRGAGMRYHARGQGEIEAAS